jgi:hypothetical protein
MKSPYKYLSAFALSGLLCLSLAFSASAQRTSTNSGSSSSSSSRPSPSTSSNGGNVSRPAPSSSGNSYRPSAGNANSYRPSVGAVRPSAGAVRPSYGSGYRPSVNNPRVGVAPPRIFSQTIRPSGNRLGVTSGTYGNRGYVAPSPNNVVGTRGYVGQGGRGSVGSGGRGWGNHYHYNHGYYNTYYTPRLGFAIGFLPYGYYSFYYDDSPYFYSDGLFYSYDNSQYTVVEPPVGAEVNSLPSNAQSIMINGQQYYEADGIYYEPITKDDGSVSYQVAGKDGELNTDGNNDQQAPQVGDTVNALPANCRKITINYEKFYVSPDGYYYQEAVDQNNNKVYKVVGTPTDEPNQ